MHCGMFNNIPGLYLLNASSNTVPVVMLKTFAPLSDVPWRDRTAPWLRTIALGR